MIRIPVAYNVIALFLLTSTSCSHSTDTSDGIVYTGTGAPTKGLATTTTSNQLANCQGARVSAVGSIGSADGQSWIVPAETSFATALKASDIYNECTGVTFASPDQISLANVPVTIFDPDGIIVTAYIFADNYFELYINGAVVAVDPVPYTPFNSSVVQFKVKKPYTIAMKLVDWEENLGVGTEVMNTNKYYSGDAGMVAYFSDGTKTDATWKAQTFYIAPLSDVSLVVERADGTRSSTTAPLQPNCNALCYALHWPIPSNWNAKNYNDAGWPNATVYTTSAAGVANKPAYTNFATLWLSSSFIWSSNLTLDNVVLVRKTVQ